MKFLAKSDGTIIGRVANSKLVFPIPSDIIVCDCPIDIPESILPNGSTINQFINAKFEALKLLYQPYIDTSPVAEEFIDGSDCDTVNSTLITCGGVAKTTSIRPGGELYTQVHSVSNVSKYVFHFNTFIYGSKETSYNNIDYSCRFYNFDEGGQNFIDPSLLNVQVSLYTDALVLIEDVVPDELRTLALPDDFVVGFYNGSSYTVYLSDWMMMFKTGE
jgi:hypothetical protein